MVGDFNAWMPGHAEAYDIPADWGAHAPEDHRRAFLWETTASLLENGHGDALGGGTGDPPAPSVRGPARSRVDHVLVTRDLAASVVDARIPVSDAIERASDHRPVVVRHRVGDWRRHRAIRRRELTVR